MADKFNSPGSNRDDGSPGFDVDSFLSDIAKVSKLEAKFIINTKPIDYPGSPFSEEIIQELRQIVDADLSGMVRGPGAPKVVRITTGEPRLDEGEIAFRSEAVDKTDGKSRTILPVSVINTADGEKKASLEFFDSGTAAYISKFDVEADEDGSISIGRYGVVQLDSAAFQSAIDHLKESFEPDGRSRPSCLKDLIRGLSELVFSEYTQKHISDSEGISGPELESALEVESGRLKKKFNIPEVLGGEVVSAAITPTDCSALVKFDVAFTTILKDTPYEQRMIFTAVSQIYLDKMGVVNLRIDQVDNFRSEGELE